MKRHTPRITGPLALACALAFTAAACGDGDDEAGVSVDAAWARTSPASAQAGAAYFQLSSDDDDALIGVSVDSSIAGEAQIHETSMVDQSAMEDEAMDDGAMDDGAMDDGAMDDEAMDDEAMEDEAMDDGDHGGDMGVMQMVEVGRIDIPAGETVSLEPGGFHIMLLDLPAPLENGATFDLTLDFETAPDQVVTVEVRDGAPE